MGGDQGERGKRVVKKTGVNGDWARKRVAVG
jgi:hypothetical protein